MRKEKTGMRGVRARAELLAGITMAVVVGFVLLVAVSINTAASDEDAEPTAVQVSAASELDQFEKEVAKARAAAPEQDTPVFGDTDYQTEAKPEVMYRYIGKYRVTGYDACVSCCGKTDAVTASGTKAEVGRTIAAPREFPFGTVIYIEGVGERVVEDRGGAIKGGKIDLFCANHADCYAVTGWYECYIVEEVA